MAKREPNIPRMIWRDKQFGLNDECPGCGCIMHVGGKDDATLCTVDHIIPLAEGGTDEEWNWSLLCKGCNNAKGDYMEDDRA
jgi:5-methylcytosine-specific restriction endonuclease McrA